MVSAFLSSVALVIVASVRFSEANAVFCYEDPACDTKSTLWPGICQTGTRQSPIDLRKGLTSIIPVFAPLTFNGGYSASQFLMKDNGHTVQISFNSQLTSGAQMTGYGLDVPYTFAQAHFHWGENALSGSEHTIMGLRHPMELHLVHYSTKYASFSAAAASGDPKALAVVGVFIDPTPNLGALSLVPTVPAFDVVAQNLPMKFGTTDEVINKTIDLSQFLPKTGEAFYRYDGSLTTPGCSEIVIWTVVEKPKIVKYTEYQKFHNVEGEEEGHALGKNFRPTFSAAGRKVEYLHKL